MIKNDNNTMERHIENSSNQPKTSSVQGGTPEQHARAGRKGGLAHHVCRGRGCKKNKPA